MDPQHLLWHFANGGHSGAADHSEATRDNAAEENLDKTHKARPVKRASRHATSDQFTSHNRDKTQKARESRQKVLQDHPGHHLSDITKNCLVALVTAGVLKTTR